MRFCPRGRPAWALLLLSRTGCPVPHRNPHKPKAWFILAGGLDFPAKRSLMRICPTAISAFRPTLPGVFLVFAASRQPPRLVCPICAGLPAKVLRLLLKAKAGRRRFAHLSARPCRAALPLGFQLSLAFACVSLLGFTARPGHAPCHARGRDFLLPSDPRWRLIRFCRGFASRHFLPTKKSLLLLPGLALPPICGALLICRPGPAERPCRAALPSGPVERPCRAALSSGPAASSSPGPLPASACLALPRGLAMRLI